MPGSGQQPSQARGAPAAVEPLSPRLSLALPLISQRSRLRGSGQWRQEGGPSLHLAAVLKLCLPASKDPAWPGTTVKEGRPAPPPGGALPSPSTDPAPSATTAHRGHCALCPVLGVRWGAAQVSLCPAPPPLPAGGPSFSKIQPQSLGTDTSSTARPSVGRGSGAPVGVDTSAAGCAPCRSPPNMPAVPPAAEEEEPHVPSPDPARGRAAARKHQGPVLRTGRPVWGRTACALPPLHPGGTSEASCKPCPAGSFCPGRGLSPPTGPCAAGPKCPSDPAACGPVAHPCPQVLPRGHRREPRPQASPQCLEGPQHPVP